MTSTSAQTTPAATTPLPVPIVNNCGSAQTFEYNYYDAAPGTGAYHQVAAGSTYSVGSDDGIWRVELPKGVFNLFVYNGNWSSVTMY